MARGLGQIRGNAGLLFCVLGLWKSLVSRGEWLGYPLALPSDRLQMQGPTLSFRSYSQVLLTPCPSGGTAGAAFCALFFCLLDGDSAGTNRGSMQRLNSLAGSRASCFVGSTPGLDTLLLTWAAATPCTRLLIWREAEAVGLRQARKQYP